MCIDLQMQLLNLTRKALEINKDITFQHTDVSLKLVLCIFWYAFCQKKSCFIDNFHLKLKKFQNYDEFLRLSVVTPSFQNKILVPLLPQNIFVKLEFEKIFIMIYHIYISENLLNKMLKLIAKFPKIKCYCSIDWG